MASEAYYRTKAEEHKSLAEQARRQGNKTLEAEHMRRAKQYDDLADKAD